MKSWKAKFTEKQLDTALKSIGLKDWERSVWIDGDIQLCPPLGEESGQVVNVKDLLKLQKKFKPLSIFIEAFRPKIYVTMSWNNSKL